MHVGVDQGEQVTPHRRDLRWITSRRGIVAAQRITIARCFIMPIRKLMSTTLKPPSDPRWVKSKEKSFGLRQVGVDDVLEPPRTRNAVERETPGAASPRV